MKKTFVIQVEYPDCDFVSSEEIADVAQECIDQYLERYFGANIMDGDYDRIKVKEVTDGFSLVKRMREAQQNCRIMERVAYKWTIDDMYKYDALRNEQSRLEQKVDEYLKMLSN